MTTIKVPKVFWSLGDPEQTTHSGVTTTVRPLYHSKSGENGTYVRVGTIDPDHAEAVMDALENAQ